MMKRLVYLKVEGRMKGLVYLKVRGRMKRMAIVADMHVVQGLRSVLLF